MRFYYLLFCVLTFLLQPQIADAATISQIQQTECGLNESGGIKPGDGTLCKQDIAFGMMYELFPSIINELIPFWDLSMYSSLGDTPNTPELLGEYRGDLVFFVLFDLFYKLVLLCIAMYIFVLVISTGLRWLKGEKLSDNTQQKDTPKSWALGAVIGGSFLIPYKQFFVGQLIVFSFAITSLSMANFTLSLILSGNQEMYKMTMSSTSPDESTGNRSGIVDRHSFFADSFYRNLTRMQLCKSQTSEYILTARGGGFTTPEIYKKAAKCTLPQVRGESDVPDLPPAFTHFNTSMSTNGNGADVFFSGDTSILFKNEASTESYCEINGESLPNYDCGSMTVSYPDWSRNPLIRLFGDESGDLIQNAVSGLQTTISPGMSESTLQSAVYSGWVEFRDRLLAKLESSYFEDQALDEQEMLVAVNNEVVTKKDALQEALIDNARPHVQQAAQLYHQMAMNILMFGQAQSHQIVDSVNPVSEIVTDYGSENWNSFFYHMDKAEKLAFMVSEIQCMDYKYDLHKSESTAKFLRGELASVPQSSSARCLDVETATVGQFDPSYKDKDKDQIRSEAIAQFELMKTEFVRVWEREVFLLAEQRRAVETSFVEASKNDAENEWWINLRQKGYLAAADYAQGMSERVNGFKRDLIQVVNNFQVDVPSYDDRYISHSIELSYDNNDSFVPYTYAGESLFKTTILPPGTKDPIISNAAWVVEQEQIMRESPIGMDTTNFVSDVKNLLNLSTTYLDRLGIGLSEGAKDPDKCMTDPKYCSFPMSDPIVEISLMGHDMVDASVWFFASAIPAKLLTGSSMEKIRADKQRGKTSVGKETWMDNLKNRNSMISKMVTVLPKGVLNAATVMDMLFDYLSSIMTLFFTLGLVLAYLLPLVPKIYLYFTFVSWFFVVVMASFSVLLWTFFWVRIKEKREILKMAAFHYGVEILFKPTFSLLSVIFAWYFFYVVTFIIGGSANWLFIIPSDGLFGWAFHTLFVLVMIIFTYVVGLKYAYQLMSDMTSSLLQKLGVNDSKQNDKISETVKVILFEHAKNLTERGLSNIDNKHGRDSGKAYMQQRAKEAQNTSKLYNQGMNEQMRKMRASDGGQS